MFVAILFNHFSLYMSKATLLTFLYEIFPPRLRRVLHCVTIAVVCLFLASLLETLLWCRPLSTMWEHTAGPGFARSGGYCILKLIPVYNNIQFSTHLFSTLLIIVLPLVAMRWGGRGAFAVSVLGLGAVSVIASCVAFVCLVNLRPKGVDPRARHAIIISSQADQNALFMAACLSVLRVRRGKQQQQLEGESGMSQARVEIQRGKGLIIQVERRFSLTIDFVEAWPVHWKDPWVGARGSVQSTDGEDSESIPFS